MRGATGLVPVHRLVYLVALCLAVTACASGASTVRDGAGSEGGARAERSLADGLSEARAAFAEHRTALYTRDASAAIEAELAERATANDPVYAVVAELYAARDFAPLILADGRWSDDAEALTLALADAHDAHALRGKYPARARFIEPRVELDRLSDELDTLSAFEGSDAEWAAVATALEAEGFDPSSEDAAEQIVSRLHSSDARHNPMPRLPERLQALAAHGESWQLLMAETEVELALAAVRFADEMRLAYDENSPRLGLFRERTTAATRQRARLRAWLGFLSRHGAQRALAQVEPPHPQYPGLVEARRRYAGILAAGGWPQLDIARFDKLSRGRSHAAVPAIKARLAIEGYFEGDTTSDVYDDALVRAVETYQRTHQIDDDGQIDSKLVDNLNLPVEDRLAKIDVTLQRYRESLVGTFDYYVLVNLPDFNAEIWRGRERRMRFGIVVGKNDLKRDANGKVVFDRDGQPLYPNRTPQLTSFIQRVIYNPYWNVPPRIRMEEYDPLMAENPFWLEENGFEMVNPEDPDRSWIRQLPGDDNALGRVKFIFPNPWDVYLHDTPKKRLFRHPVRAYSHGCMRVSEPMELAEFLLREDGRWNAAQVRDILRTEPLEETTINLRRDVPVHIAYFNTRVDDDGHVHFLSDVYRYDRDLIEARREVLASSSAP